MVEDLKDLKRIASEVEGDKVGRFASKEWHRLLKPFVPQRTKQLVNNVTYEPWEYTHNVPYAGYIYRGEKYVDPEYKKGGFTNGNIWWSRKGVTKMPSGQDLNFRKDMAKYASKEWDKAGTNAGKDKDLAQSIENYIKQTIL